MKKLIRCFLATTFAVAMLVAAGLDTSWREAHAQGEGLSCATRHFATGRFCGWICGRTIRWRFGRIEVDEWCIPLRYCRLEDFACGPFPE